MSLWTKLNTLFRASAEEPLHHLVDANSIRIFEQEIRDGQKAIQQAKLQLATVMAEKSNCNGTIRRCRKTSATRSVRPARHWTRRPRRWRGMWRN